jgi:hypothetical protein
MIQCIVFEMKKEEILMSIAVTILLLAFFSIPDSFGHGMHHDVTPKQKIGDLEVNLKFTSSPVYDPDSNAREISFQLMEANSENIIKDTVFDIKTVKTNEFLFEYTSETQNDGLLILELVPTESETITIEEKKDVVSKESPSSPSYDLVSIQSKDFDTGGLYFFEVKILEAEKKVLNAPLVFSVQIPFPHKTFHEIDDPNFGKQTIRLISYFDKSEDFQYEPQTRTISFFMPYEWTDENINKTSVVHEELTIPKTFGDLMVSGFKAEINDVQIPTKLITLDEFFADAKLVHVILSHGDLLELKKRQDSNVSGMKFVLEPYTSDIPFSSITENGEFRIIVDPKNFQAGSKAKILFNIFQMFPEYVSVETNYKIYIISEGEKIFSHSGRSANTVDSPNEIEFDIPENVKGPISLVFYEIGDNPIAKTVLPVKIINKEKSDNLVDNVTHTIPEWIRNNAKWWAQGAIGDNDFVSGIQYLIKEDIMQIPETTSTTTSKSDEIPSWIKNNADWWSQGLISDDDFVKGIQYLVEQGIIRV